MSFPSRRLLPLPVATVVLLQAGGATAMAGPAVTHPPAARTAILRPAAATECPPPGGRKVPAAAVAASGIVVQGHGWGHGLGLSQYGAQGAARLGCTHAQILRAYFAGTRLARPAMTAPVELALHTAARRSTVFTESAPVRWTVAGRTLTQPARTTWTVTVTGSLTTLTAGGARLAQVGPGRTLQVLHAGTVVRLRSFTSSAPAATSSVDLRLRQGNLTFTAGATAVTVAETIGGDPRGSAVDRYLWGVGEVPVTWPRAALRAQADAARTYLARTYDSRLRRYAIGVTTAAQVYAGADHEDADTRNGSPWRAAVVATHDEVIVDSRGAPIWAMYSSSGGGRVESRAYVYGSQGGYGYLVGLDDSRWDLASDNPRRSWARVFAPDDLARRLGFSTLRAVSLAASGTGGRADGLVVTGIRSGATVTVRFTGDQIRYRLGLPSPVISVSWTAGRPPTSPPPTTSSGGGPAPGPSTGRPPATPIPSTFRSAACNGTSCGHVTARFSGAHALVDVQESVQDATCNRRRAYVRLRVRYTDGTWQLTPPRYAANRCRPPATVYTGLSWRAARPIAGFTVVVGEAGGAGLAGRYVDNPHS